MSVVYLRVAVSSTSLENKAKDANGVVMYKTFKFNKDLFIGDVKRNIVEGFHELGTPLPCQNPEDMVLVKPNLKKGGGELDETKVLGWYFSQNSDPTILIDSIELRPLKQTKSRPKEYPPPSPHRESNTLLSPISSPHTPSTPFSPNPPTAITFTLTPIPENHPTTPSATVSEISFSGSEEEEDLNDSVSSTPSPTNADPSPPNSMENINDRFPSLVTSHNQSGSATMGRKMGKTSLLVSDGLIFQPPYPPLYTEELLANLIYCETHGDKGGKGIGKVPIIMYKYADREDPDYTASHTILYSHDTYEDMGSSMKWLQLLRDVLRVDILAYEYTGYGLWGSGGSGLKPSEKESYHNLRSAYYYLTNTLFISPSKIILMGKGLGTCPTMRLAASLCGKEKRDSWEGSAKKEKDKKKRDSWEGSPTKSGRMFGSFNGGLFRRQSSLNISPTSPTQSTTTLERPTTPVPVSATLTFSPPSSRLTSPLETHDFSLRASLSASLSAAPTSPSSSSPSLADSSSSQLSTQSTPSEQEKGPIAGVILQSPFLSVTGSSKSMSALALPHFSYFDNLRHAEKVTCPTLIIHGTLDERLPIKGVKRLASVLPNLHQLAEIEGAGHRNLETGCYCDDVIDPIISYLKALDPSFSKHQTREIPKGIAFSPAHVIATWLEEINLTQYKDIFLASGYFDLEIIGTLQELDFQVMGIENEDHRRIMLENIKSKTVK